MPGGVLTDDFGALQPGEMVSVALLDPGRGPISGQVLAADDKGITIFEPPADRFESGYFEEIPADRIASITRRGSAPMSVTIADAFTGNSEETERTSMLGRLRASPLRAGFGFGFIGLPLWFGGGYLLAAIDKQGAGAALLWAVSLVGLGLLTGLTIPGQRGWSGYLLGGLAVAILIGFLGAIWPSDPANSQPGIPTITGPAAIVAGALVGGVLIVISSAGYPIASIVRRLRNPSKQPGSRDQSSGDIGAR